jgi:hypothetical protein
MRNTILLIMLALAYPLATVKAQTPAFPGAEGHGRYASGGRGGTVYYVTTLEDNNNQGSLRYAVTRSGPRTVLFAVSGTIWLNSKLDIKNDNLTIAGQSAPGDGVCVAGFPVSVDANNVIIRYIRCRMGDLKDVNADGADALGGRRHKNIIIDHCSVSWSTDECCSFYENSNFTMQWCLISESLNYSQHSKGAHGYGGIWGGMKASFHHNLLAHNKSRVPRLGPGATSTPTNELCDVRNNVYYNYQGEGCYGAEAMHVNIVNNYYKAGPAGASLSSAKKGRIIAIDKKIDNSFPILENVWGTFYIDGNVVEGHANATNDNWMYGVYNQIHSKYGALKPEEKEALRLSEPLETDVVTTHTPEQAYEQVTAYAGCSFVRDALDIRIIGEVLTNTATFMGAQSKLKGIIDSQQDLKPSDAGDDWSAWPDLAAGTPATDTDKDGIPDGWLSAHYTGKTATDTNEEGYTYLEVYLNGIVSDITENQNRGGEVSIGTPAARGRDGITCYADAVAGTLTVRAEGTIREVALFSVAGRKMYSAAVGACSKVIDLSGFTNGIYIVKAVCGDYNTPCVAKIRI